MQNSDPPQSTNKFKTVSSDGNCVIDGQPDDSIEVKNTTKVKQKTYDTKDMHQKWYFIPIDTITTNEPYLEATATYTGTKNFKISEVSVDGIQTNYNSNQNKK